MTRNRMPTIGIAWDPDYCNMAENFDRLADELVYYRPRGFAKLRDELRRYAATIDSDDDAAQNGFEASDEACELLTEWARRKLRHEYVSFVQDAGFCGFTYNVESAIEDAEWRIDDNGWRIYLVPLADNGGLLVEVNDHGNVTVTRLSRGRRRELFAVV